MDESNRGWRLSRRGFLAGTIAAALAACSSDGDDGSPASTSGGSPSTSAPTATGAPAAGSSTSTTATPTSTTTSSTVPSPVTTDPFTLGVASGDPLPDSVILWTRLLPGAPLPDVDVEVGWEVATDDGFAEVVASGTTTAVAALGHSVHVDASGLEPDREYHYRFRVGGFESPPARTRTFAAPGTMPERFRFAFSSCQRWEHGYYAAYRDLVEQGDVEAFVFLGDYIYETASRDVPEGGRSTGQDFECVTLDQYRQRYAVYKSDPNLQAAHALVPWIITWDDHEVDNDYAGASSERDDPADEFLARRAAGYQAWYEHMPVRLDPPTGPDYEIHRRVAHGDLLTFHVLDTRQYRSDQQRGEPFIAEFGNTIQVRDDALVLSEAQTMLGDDQRAWLIEGITASTAVWDVLAQQVFMFGANVVAGEVPPVIVPDTWDGYAGERQRLLDAIGPVADNLVVLTGDFHAAAVGELRADPFDLSLPVVGVELMATSISSAFVQSGSDEVTQLAAAAIGANEQIEFFDGRRGYTVCEVTPQRWTATYRAVADQLDAASPVDPIATFEITAGTAGVTQTS